MAIKPIFLGHFTLCTDKKHLWSTEDELGYIHAELDTAAKTSRIVEHGGFT